MLKNNNHTYATPGFQGFLNSCLHDIYAGTGIKVKPETIKYAMYDDCDYAVIYETMQFTMGDGRSWEIYSSNLCYNIYVEEIIKTIKGDGLNEKSYKAIG